MFREGFGRVWGRFWDGLGRVWEPFGRCWALPGLLYAVFRGFLYFLYFWRRRRAERRERSERCEAPGRLFAVFRYLLLLLVIFDCFVTAWAVFGRPAKEHGPAFRGLNKDLRGKRTFGF